mmetsp:Transcript_44599/g.96941  ORF Transcript_44599/g.96941 Transcript_44599/m.96941 type:complete len:249 (+) Transcript_44599:1012-1758(+)
MKRGGHVHPTNPCDRTKGFPGAARAEGLQNLGLELLLDRLDGLRSVVLTEQALDGHVLLWPHGVKRNNATIWPRVRSEGAVVLENLEGKVPALHEKAAWLSQDPHKPRVREAPRELLVEARVVLPPVWIKQNTTVNRRSLIHNVPSRRNKHWDETEGSVKVEGVDLATFRRIKHGQRQAVEVDAHLLQYVDADVHEGEAPQDWKNARSRVPECILDNAEAHGSSQKTPCQDEAVVDGLLVAALNLPSS